MPLAGITRRSSSRYTAGDTLSGVASALPVSPVVISTQGSNQTQVVTVTDVAGNIKTFTSPGVNIDLTAPTASAIISPATNAAGWNKTNVTVTISATDNVGGSGVAAIIYSASGAQTITTTTVSNRTASFVISTEGTTTITYSARDRAGNTNVAQTVTVKLDKTMPTLTWGALPPANAAGWYTTNTSVSIWYTAADILSGVASALPTSPIVITNQGANQTQVVTVTDVAGNSKAFTSPAVNIDRTAPTVTAATSPSAANRSPRRMGASTVTVSGRVTDSISGVNTTIRNGTYTITDSSHTTIPSGTFTVAATGSYSFKVSFSTANTNPRGVPRTYTITVHASDKAGNIGSAVTTFVVQ